MSNVWALPYSNIHRLLKVYALLFYQSISDNQSSKTREKIPTYIYSYIRFCKTKEKQTYNFGVMDGINTIRVLM